MSTESEWLPVFAAITQAAHMFPPEVRRALQEWEAANLGHGDGKGTSDWPGWDAYLAPCFLPALHRLQERPT